jgi:hypothetical protein
MMASWMPSWAEVLILLIFAGFLAVWWQIFKKTGNSGWLSLLMLVPLVNLAMLLFLAFSDRPVLRELRALRSSRSVDAS